MTLSPENTLALRQWIVQLRERSLTRRAGIAAQTVAGRQRGGASPVCRLHGHAGPARTGGSGALTGRGAGAACNSTFAPGKQSERRFHAAGARTSLRVPWQRNPRHDRLLLPEHALLVHGGDSIVGLGLLIGALLPSSHPVYVAKQPRQSAPAAGDGRMAFVGRITAWSIADGRRMDWD